MDILKAKRKTLRFGYYEGDAGLILLPISKNGNGIFPVIFPGDFSAYVYLQP